MISKLSEWAGDILNFIRPRPYAERPKTIINSPKCNCESFDETNYVRTDSRCVYDIMQMHALEKYGIEVNSWRVNPIPDNTHKVVYLYNGGDREFSFTYYYHYKRISKKACLTCGTCLGWELPILKEFDENHEYWVNSTDKIKLANKICNLLEERKKDDSN